MRRPPALHIVRPRTVCIPGSLIRQYPNGYAIRVDGWSMFPALHSNDILFIDPDAEPRDGDIVVAAITSGLLLGRLRTSGSMRLEKDNRKFSAVPLDSLEQVRAVVIALISRLVVPEVFGRHEKGLPE